MGFLKKLFKREPKGVNQRTWWGTTTNTVSNQIVTTETAMRVAAVFACVKVISESIASLPLHTYKRLAKGKERDVNHPIYWLLHSYPNSWQTSFDFRNLQMVNVLLGGNFYARKYMTGGGELGELVPLNPKSVTPHWNKAKTEIVYDFNESSSKTVELKQGDIFHLRGLSMDGIMGLAPITAAREAIGLSMAAEQHAAALFGNGARPGAIIYHTNPLSEQARNTFVKDWTEKFQGSGMGKIAMLQSGEAKYETLGMSNEDAQFIEVRQFQLSEIARIFRVPPHLIGDLSKATFSNIEQQSLEFVMHCLRPWLVNIEQTIMRSLFTEEERRTHFVEFSVDGLLRGDISARFAAYNTGIMAGFLSRDEVRELENRNPIPEGEGEIFLQPLNMKEAGQDDPEPAKQDSQQSDQNDKQRGLNPEIVRDCFLAIASESISRAVKKDCELARKAISNGTLEDYARGLVTKNPDFMPKILKRTIFGYARCLNSKIEESFIDTFLNQLTHDYYRAFSSNLIEDPNAGVVIEQRDDSAFHLALAELFLDKLKGEIENVTQTN